MDHTKDFCVLAVLDRFECGTDLLDDMGGETSFGHMPCIKNKKIMRNHDLFIDIRITMMYYCIR